MFIFSTMTAFGVYILMKASNTNMTFGSKSNILLISLTARKANYPFVFDG